jgi:hypothetical protein
MFLLHYILSSAIRRNFQLVRLTFKLILADIWLDAMDVVQVLLQIQQPFMDRILIGHKPFGLLNKLEINMLSK